MNRPDHSDSRKENIEMTEVKNQQGIALLTVMLMLMILTVLELPPLR